jgi:prepilin-type N-terminal cleavage/methylation domain-containing protein
MSPRRFPISDLRIAIRRGVTLVELLVATALLSLIAVGLASFARTVEIGSDYGYGRATAAQHARVVLERIGRAVNQAQATEIDPGFAILSETYGTSRLADTLVVWTSDANRDQLPQVHELTIFTPNGQAPGELIELSFPGDSRTVSLVNNSGLKTLVDSLRSDANRRQVVLTNLLRTVDLPEDSGRPHAAVVFSGFSRPSAAELASFRGGTTAWENLSWPQGVYGGKAGLRQGYVRFELQLMPGDGPAAAVRQIDETLPFFGSAAVYYEITK